MGEEFYFQYRVGTSDPSMDAICLDNWEERSVAYLKNRIWEKSENDFKNIDGIRVPGNLSLWLHNEGKPEESKRLSIKQKLGDVFKGAEKEVSVTPLTAKKWNDAFVVRATPPAPTVSEVFEGWRKNHSKFIKNFNDAGRKLPIWENPSDLTKTLPKSWKGKPLILLDRLGDETWTKNSILWKKAEIVTSGLVPIAGVSGSGKTRFLYELLASRWGLYFTASAARNGGSRDLDDFRKRGVVSNDVVNFEEAGHCMRCAILSRLLILEYCSKELDDFKPLDWLLLQTEFLSFVDGGVDPFGALATNLLAVPGSSIVFQLQCVWKSWQGKHSGQPGMVMALDEAQALSEGLAVYETETGSKWHIFAPFVRTFTKAM